MKRHWTEPYYPPIKEWGLPWQRKKALERCEWCGRHKAVAYQSRYWHKKNYRGFPCDFCSTECWNSFSEGLGSWLKSLWTEDVLLNRLLLLPRKYWGEDSRRLNYAQLSKLHMRILSAEKQIARLSKALRSYLSLRSPVGVRALLSARRLVRYCATTTITEFVEKLKDERQDLGERTPLYLRHWEEQQPTKFYF